MPYTFQGQTFDAVPVTKMTPGEVAQVERITGQTFSRIRRSLTTCVCDHSIYLHDTDDETKCTACPCEVFDADIATAVNYALLFIALKRVKPEATYAQIEATPRDEWTFEPTAAEEDPTTPPDPSPAE